MENTSRYRTAILLLFMLLIIGLRIIGPLSPEFKLIANFAGVGAVALFGGAYFKNNVIAFLLPVLVLFLSDLGLMLTMGVDYGLYNGIHYTYIAFILMVLVGRLMIGKVNVASVLGASIVGVLIHWVISDIPVWLGSTEYPQTLAGFVLCLNKAIPFELRFLYGTLGYSALMFGAFEALKVKFPALNLVKQTSVN